MRERTFELVAAFTQPAQAEGATRSLEKQGMSVSCSTRSDDEVAQQEMRAEMRDEVDHLVAGPAIGAMSGDQARGAFSGVLVGGALGFVVGLVIGGVWLAASTTPSPIAKMLIAAASFTFGGATIGFIAGGAAFPRLKSRGVPHDHLDDTKFAAERGAVVAVKVSDEKEATKARKVLQACGALRVDAVGVDGRM